MSSLQAKLQHKYALSEKGAKDMIKAFVSVTVSNLVLMVPIALLYYMVKDYMEGNLAGKGLWQSSCVRSRYPSSEKKICPI